MAIIPSNISITLPFILPVVEYHWQDICCSGYQGDGILDHTKECHAANIQVLAYGIQQAFDPRVIKRYLQAYSESEIQACLGIGVQQASGSLYIPILFYAVERNCPELIRTLCEAGALPEQRAQPSGLPLLVYTIISAEYELTDVTDTLVALLAMGAGASDIPSALWENYLEALSRHKHSISTSSIWNPWLTPSLLDALCHNLTLLHRYYLHKSLSIGKPSPRMLQVARAFDFLPLFETSYHIIGQHKSIQEVLKCLISHYLYSASTPLVLLLTGMSGHGKTELAKRMGTLLSLAFHRVDMTEMKYETDIFGPKAPYQGHEKGSVLNNFLAQHSGERSVIFLDEFEKTTNSVRQSMLLVLESGFYKDRRNDKALDCTKTIWILAANLGEDLILKFYLQYLQHQPESAYSKAPYSTLQRDLSAQFTTALGAPMTGRLSSIIPFFPFSESEQAVTTYKFMRELWTMVRGPISVSQKKFARHTYLNFVNDSAIAQHLAQKHYTPQLGARSLEKAVIHDMRAPLAYKQMEDLEEFKDEMNERALVCFDVRLVSAKDGGEEEAVEVVRSGDRELLSQKMEMKEELVEEL